MKAFMKKMVRYLVDRLPSKLCLLCLPLFSKVIDPDEIEKRTLQAFTDKLMHDYDRLIGKIVSKGKIMYIKKMTWGGSYFNIAVLNNLLGLIVYSLYLGYIPIISINEDQEDWFSWEWYFKQPLEDYNSVIKEKTRTTLKKTSVGYMSEWLFNQAGENYERWRFIYQKFCRLNDKTKAYVDSENKNLGDLATTLGVLVRGTDYISLKPQGHPIQPDFNDVLKDAKKNMSENPQYKSIYVATDEKRYFDAFEAEFGKGTILSNKRVYYDQKYVAGGLIGRVKFDRENDNYLKGLEYLSSMVLLSKCDGLLAGNCGGTKFALLYADPPYSICKIFNRGFYK